MNAWMSRERQANRELSDNPVEGSLRSYFRRRSEGSADGRRAGSRPGLHRPMRRSCSDSRPCWPLPLSPARRKEEPIDRPGWKHQGFNLISATRSVLQRATSCSVARRSLPAIALHNVAARRSAGCFIPGAPSNSSIRSYYHFFNTLLLHRAGFGHLLSAAFDDSGHRVLEQSSHSFIAIAMAGRRAMRMMLPCHRTAPTTVLHASQTSPLLLENLKKYKPIEGKTVAKALLKIAQRNNEGFKIYEWDAIQEIGN